MMKEHETQAKSLINVPLFMIFLQQRAPDKFSSIMVFLWVGQLAV